MTRRHRINAILTRLSAMIIAAMDNGVYPDVWIKRAQKLADVMKG